MNDADIIELLGASSEPLLNQTLLLILGSTLVTTLALVVLIIGLCIRVRKLNRDGYSSTRTSDSAHIDLDKLPSNQAYHCTGMKLNPLLEALEYPRNDIIYIRDIGQGAFGRVFQVSVNGVNGSIAAAARTHILAHCAIKKRSGASGARLSHIALHSVHFRNAADAISISHIRRRRLVSSRVKNSRMSPSKC